MLGYREYAEDAAEDAMASAFGRWDTLTNPTAWVRTAGRHNAQHAEIRARRQRERDTDHVRDLYAAYVHTSQQAMEFAVELDATFKLIADMPPRRREVVALAFDGHMVGDIAQILAIKQSTVRSHLRHARQTLSEGLWQKGETS